MYRRLLDGIHLLIVFAVVSILSFLRTIILVVYGFFPFPSALDALFRQSKQLQNFNFHLRERKRANVARDTLAQSGCSLQEHFVITEDGFVLVLHRIVVDHGYNGHRGSLSTNQPTEATTTPLPPVLLMHGLMQDSETFICAGETSLGVILAKAGFDVWLGNNRGNRYSHKHLHLTPSDEKYWDFCIDDLARIDVPSMLEYIKTTTGLPQVSYIGLSQGTAQAFAAFALRPKLSETVPIFIALAPAIRAAGLSPSILSSVVSANLGFINVMFGRRSMLGSVTSWQRILTPWMFTQFVTLSMAYLFGWHCNTIHPQNREKLFQHIYSYSSVKCVIHWFQLIRLGKLAMYQDTLSYGHEPVFYDIKAIKCPIALFYGQEDTLIDAQAAIEALPAHKIAKVHAQKGYEHLDMLWGDDAHETFFPEIVRLLKEFSHKNSAATHCAFPSQDATLTHSRVSQRSNRHASNVAE